MILTTHRLSLSINNEPSSLLGGTGGMVVTATLTFDYQFIKNPAYNSDRGPVSIFSGRMHAEF